MLCNKKNKKNQKIWITKLSNVYEKRKKENELFERFEKIGGQNESNIRKNIQSVKAR